MIRNKVKVYILGLMENVMTVIGSNESNTVKPILLQQTEDKREGYGKMEKELDGLRGKNPMFLHKQVKIDLFQSNLYKLFLEL